MFILKKGHQPGVYMPLRALFLVFLIFVSDLNFDYIYISRGSRQNLLISSNKHVYVSPY